MRIGLPPASRSSDRGDDGEEPMPLYRRVMTEADLPPVGTSWESSACDFKSDCDSTRFTEMAKDMAAFANATGGVIIIKAAEARTRLLRYIPMDRQEADSIRAAYECAAKDHCVPSLQVRPATVTHELAQSWRSMSTRSRRSLSACASSPHEGTLTTSLGRASCSPFDRGPPLNG